MILKVLIIEFNYNIQWWVISNKYYSYHANNYYMNEVYNIFQCLWLNIVVFRYLKYSIGLSIMYTRDNFFL